MEYIIAFVLIVATLLFFIFRKSSEPPKKGKDKKKNKEEFNKISNIIEEIKNCSDNEDADAIVTNAKDYVINHFRDTKDLRKIYSFVGANSVTLVFCDDKRMLIGYLSSFTEKNMKFISKSIDQDIIVDLGYSEDKSRIAVALKNSKEILFYDVVTDRSGKKSLTKMENKVIKTKHKYEIKALAFSKSGNYVTTSGKDDDTSCEIYDAKTLAHLQTVDIKEIKNIEIRFTPDERYLTVSTFMYEIGVIEFNKTTKSTKNTTEEEVTLTIKRKKSVGGIKVPIKSYEFSNEQRYFVVTCEQGKIKILENFPPNYAIEDSKVVQEIEVKEKGFDGEKVSLYILDVAQPGCKLNGLIAVSNNTNIHIYNLEGKLLKLFKNAHDVSVVFLKLVRDFTSDDHRKVNLISASRDGKFQIWDLKLN